MTAFTFIHAADIHLDSPLDGLTARDPLFSEKVRGATRRALENLVALAIDEGAKFLLVAGDLYDGTLRNMATAQFAMAQFARLSRAGIRVVIVHGNHDAESRITRHVTPPEGVFRLDNKRCDTVPFDDIGVAIHGRSYKEAHTFENLAQTYCPPVPGRLNIAMLHTALEGHAAHAPYAPCSVAELAAQGHDYWALGHVHDHAVHRTGPYVVYPGNLQGRNVRETGPKGAVVVRVVVGEIVSLEFRALDEVRWARASIDATAMSSDGELIEALRAEFATAWRGAEDRTLAARVEIATAGSFGDRLLSDVDWVLEEARAAAGAIAEDIWVEKLKLKPVAETGPARLPPELEDWLARAAEDPECRQRLEAALAPLTERLHTEIGGEEAPLLAAARAKEGGELIGAARRLITARLGQRGVTP